MSYDEEQQRRSRVVVETPTARREVVRTETSRVPDRQGMSTGVVAALVIGAVALTTIVFLFLSNRNNETTNANVRVATTQPTPIQQPQQPVIIQQPAPQQQQPVVIEQPAAQPPVVITQPAPASSSSSSTTTAGSASTKPRGTDDATIQSNIDKKMSDDPKFASLGVLANVLDGKVTLTGTVDTPELKRQVEALVKRIEGVRAVDNQISVTGG
ncbi:MAG TPA: BON domain-containing protein [Pyrinomonadaceae bacterium]